FHVVQPEGTVAEVIYDPNASPAKTVEYPLSDRLGTASVVVTGTSTPSVTRYHYDPFGRRIDSAGKDFSGTIGNVKTGLTGHDYDDDVGLVNMQGRVYDSKLRRMLTPDPLVSDPLFGQSWNPYSYVMNDPVNLVDPSGW